MKLRFSGEIIDFPPPVAAADECVIAPERFLPVDLPKSGRDARNLTLFNLRKVLFFAFREGLSLTLSKIRAVLAHRKLGRRRSLIIALGTEVATGRRAIAIGGQDCPEAERLAFPRSSVMVEGAAPLDSDVAAAALYAYCRANPEAATTLRDWSRFSGNPLPVTIEDAMAAGRAIEAPPPVPDARPVLFPESGDDWLPPPPAGGRTALFLAGGGTYPCAYALPIFAGAKIPYDTVVDINPVRAAQVAARFGFAYADTDAARALERLAAYDEPILVIATYHSTHVDIAAAAFAANPKTRIMLEKPPVTTVAQLERLENLRRDGAYIEIGFNRRQIPMSIRARDLLAAETGPVVMTCIVKELAIPPSHWYHWPDQGTRITGNVCHWLDLGQYFIPAAPERMSVLGPVACGQDDGVSIVVRYQDGSRLHIVATDRGSSLRGVQEFIELRRADTTIVIDDFVRMRVMSGPRAWTRRKLVRDKGHRRMYARFMRNVESGQGPDYPAPDLRVTTAQYLRASEAFASGRPTLEIDLTDLARDEAS